MSQLIRGRIEWRPERTPEPVDAGPSPLDGPGTVDRLWQNDVRN
jgi:hypothetical protein